MAAYRESRSDHRGAIPGTLLDVAGSRRTITQLFPARRLSSAVLLGAENLTVAETSQSPTQSSLLMVALPNIARLYHPVRSKPVRGYLEPCTLRKPLRPSQ